MHPFDFESIGRYLLERKTRRSNRTGARPASAPKPETPTQSLPTAERAGDYVVECRGPHRSEILKVEGLRETLAVLIQKDSYRQKSLSRAGAVARTTCPRMSPTLAQQGRRNDQTTRIRQKAVRSAVRVRGTSPKTYPTGQIDLPILNPEFVNCRVEVRP